MITLTQLAADHINKSIEKRGKGLGLRLGVKGSGCSGLAYVIEYCDTINEDDLVFESNGVKVVLDSSFLPIVDGLTLNYKVSTLEEGFEFLNPNVVSECGCKTSFSV